MIFPQTRFTSPLLARRLSAGSEGSGTLIMRGIEFGAAGLVPLFGLGLPLG